MFKIVKRANKKQCPAYGCTNERASKKRFCAKHVHRHLKATDYPKYVYNIWKTNCRRRGIENLVTIQEFRGWCEKTGYLEKKGRKSDSSTIDRIKSHLPYTINNMQIMNHWDNSFKQDMDEVPF